MSAFNIVNRRRLIRALVFFGSLSATFLILVTLLHLANIDDPQQQFPPKPSCLLTSYHAEYDADDDVALLDNNKLIRDSRALLLSSSSSYPASIDLSRINNDQQPIPDDGIYFLETSGAPCVSAKQLCSVESAARHHPNRHIVLGVNNRHILNTRALRTLLRQHPNIVLFQIELASWLNGTILEPWLKRGLLASSKFRVEHTSDVLRLATVFKHGGIYLDLDLIVLKPMDELKNSVGLEAQQQQQHLPAELLGANNAVLIFNKYHPVLKRCMEGIATGFDGVNWANNGPLLLSRVLNEWCNTDQPISISNPYSSSLHESVHHVPTIIACNNGVHLLDSSAFYPVPYYQWKSMFIINDDEDTAEKMAMDLVNGSFAIHLWNKLSAPWPITVDSRSVLGRIAQKNCPLTSSAFGGVLQ